jgi:signal transduction histidine kinase
MPMVPIIRHVPEPDATTQEHLTLSREALDWMDDFIEDILTVGRERPLTPRTMSLEEIVRMVLAKIRVPAGITLTTRVFSGRRQGEGTMIEILVEDSGSGIPPEAMPNLFKPFNTTKGIEGTGLGLYLSREIINRHNGVLQATNRPQGGARFSILLPAEQLQAMAA